MKEHHGAGKREERREGKEKEGRKGKEQRDREQGNTNRDGTSASSCSCSLPPSIEH